MMEQIRSKVPETIGEFGVERFRDYREDKILDCKTGEEGPSGLPKSNVLYFDLEDDAWCCIRPSGTEPKIKFYMGVKGKDDAEAETKLAGLQEAVQALAR